MKALGREELNRVLAHRKDQYGNPINIPENAFVFDFKRRFVNYKRPYLPFERLDSLRQILVDYDAHYLLAGKVHQGDRMMYSHLLEILASIDKDPVLRERVHYLQNYDEELGRAMSIGADAAINIPIVGLEACGTSWEKDIANMKLLISTSDGGVADIKPIACLEVTGASYESEVPSLYMNMHKACQVTANDMMLEGHIKKQLTAYLPTISGSRMLKDYLKFLFPEQK